MKYFLLSILLGACMVQTPLFAQRVKEDTNAVISLYANARKELADTVKAMQLARKGLDMARRLKYERGVVNGLKNVALVYMQSGNNAQSLKYNNEALEYSRVHGLKEAEASVLNNIGILYQYNNVYDKAFTYFTESLKLKEQIKDTPGIAVSYGNIANSLANMEQFEEANKYFEKGLVMHRKTGNMAEIARTLSNIAGNYIRRHDHKSALPYLYESKRIYQSMQENAGIAYPYMNLGACNDASGNYDSALYYYRKAMAIYEQTGDQSNYASVLTNIGLVYREKNQLDSAELYYRRSLQLARDMGNAWDLRQVYFNMGSLMAEKGKYKEAYENMRNQIAANDSLMITEKMKTVAELNMRFQTKEMEANNKLLQNENAIKALRLKQKDTLLYATLGGILLFVALTVMLIRQNKILRGQQRMELAHKQLYAQMNPHFIFNCLTSIQHFVLENDTKSANRYLTNFASLMRQTLENSKATTIALREELKYIESYLAMEHLRFENKFEYEVQCAENVDKDAIEIPPMMVQPFAENAIRHGLSHCKNNKGRLVIRFYIEGDTLYCKVDDNGIGRERSMALKERSGGAYRSQGMAVTQERLELLSKIKNADYSASIVDKKVGDKVMGTTVIIKFPVQV